VPSFGLDTDKTKKNKEEEKELVPKPPPSQTAAKKVGGGNLKFGMKKKNNGTAVGAGVKPASVVEQSVVQSKSPMRDDNIKAGNPTGINIVNQNKP
jgi:hypothetical protein